MVEREKRRDLTDHSSAESGSTAEVAELPVGADLAAVPAAPAPASTPSGAGPVRVPAPLDRSRRRGKDRGGAEPSS